MTHGVDDDWDNRAYNDPLSDPKQVERTLHDHDAYLFWDDPDAYFDLDEDGWDEEDIR